MKDKEAWLSFQNQVSAAFDHDLSISQKYS